MKPEVQDQNREVPWVRVGVSIVAVCLAAVTYAPIGALYLTSPGLMHAMKHSDTVRTMTHVAFWTFIIAVAVYASVTRKKEIGGLLAFVLLGIALLNLGGCVAGLVGIGHATGG